MSMRHPVTRPLARARAAYDDAARAQERAATTEEDR